GFRTEDLGDPAARDAAHPERKVERDGAGRDRVEDQLLAGPELHDRAAAELLLDGRECGVHRLASFGGRSLRVSFFGHRHRSVTLLIRSVDRSPEWSAMASAGRSAFVGVVLDDVPLLARLADHLDVLRRLR